MAAPNQTDARELLRFALDLDDPEKTLDSIEPQMVQAAEDGRLEHVDRLGRTFTIVARVALLKAKFRKARQALEAAELVAAAPAADPEPAPPPRPATVLRPAQMPPVDRDWSTWLFLGGRGAGKTLAGAEWLADQADKAGSGGRLALIGPTLHDVREVMIEGVSGLMNLSRWEGGPRPRFESSRRRLIFPNLCAAYAFPPRTRKVCVDPSSRPPGPTNSAPGRGLGPEVPARRSPCCGWACACPFPTITRRSW